MNDVAAAYDRERLTQDAYADSGPLQARRTIYDFLREPWDLTTWALDHVTVPAGARVLDVGCGPGYYLAHLAGAVERIAPFPCDLSYGMVREARATLGCTTATVADAQALPFAGDAFDVVLATHMLYHVADIATAGRELARVTREHVVITTNCRDHTDEIFELLVASARDITGPDFVAPSRAFGRFLYEDAPARLGDGLVVETADEAGGVIEVPHVEPVVDYVDTLRSLYGSVLPERRWPELLEAARVRVAADIDTHGVWTTHNHVGVLVCRPA